jgi:hypothetical protein
MTIQIDVGVLHFRRTPLGLVQAPQSSRGLEQSRTLRVFQTSSCRAKRLGLRQPSAAFLGDRMKPFPG